MIKFTAMLDTEMTNMTQYGVNIGNFQISDKLKKPLLLEIDDALVTIIESGLIWDTKKKFIYRPEASSENFKTFYSKENPNSLYLQLFEHDNNKMSVVVTQELANGVEANYWYTLS